MSQYSLKQCISRNKMTLMISLASNDPALAAVAAEEGVDVIKMHTNVDHRASRTSFGSAQEYKEAFSEIRSKFQGPLGIVPAGYFDGIDKEELERLYEWGFNFFSIYAHHMPSFMLETNFEKTFAIDASYDLNDLHGVHRFPIDALEASIIKGEEYGTPLNFKDLLGYANLVERVNIPVIVPSQRAILPRDVCSLHLAGVKAIMIGAIVTGNTVESVKKAVAGFRESVDRLA